MSGQVYVTESMDLAAYLMAHLEFIEARMIAHKRHVFVLDDPEGVGEKLAIGFANSITADTLDNRKRLVTIMKSGNQTSDQRG